MTGNSGGMLPAHTYIAWEHLTACHAHGIGISLFACTLPVDPCI